MDIPKQLDERLEFIPWQAAGSMETLRAWADLRLQQAKEAKQEYVVFRDFLDVLQTGDREMVSHILVRHVERQRLSIDQMPEKLPAWDETTGREIPFGYEMLANLTRLRAQARQLAS